MWRVLLLCAAGLVGVLSVIGVVLYRGTQHVPAFYEQSLSAHRVRSEQVQLGDQFEREVLELHNQTVRVGQWQSVFTEQEVNAWLAVDLVENHPRALPPDLNEPRVKISAGQLQLACRYQSDPLSTVISIQAEAYLTERPNQVAVRIRSVRAGWIPLPLKQFLDRITQVARDNGLPLLWSQQEGDPVALFQIPSSYEGLSGKHLRIETLELREGELYLAGHTERAGEAYDEALSGAGR
jgi:hypothetical protein